MSTYVIALGGNALERKALAKAARVIARLHSEGNGIVVTHGNGPQVGELASGSSLGLGVLTGETEALIGLEIEEAIASAIGSRKGYSVPEVVLTRVMVDPNDREFAYPTKPIGKFFGKAAAGKLSHAGLRMRKLIGGYRRVVASPKPLEILEIDVIRDMLDDGKIAIACGGGGIAVAKQRGRLRYMDAVIDKDRASALLAKDLDADVLAILTNVDGAYLDFGKRRQKLIRSIDVKGLEMLLKKGAFEEGSMKPKVEACIDFVKSTGKEACIANISSPEEILLRRRLTVVQ